MAKRKKKNKPFSRWTFAPTGPVTIDGKKIDTPKGWEALTPKQEKNLEDFVKYFRDL